MQEAITKTAITVTGKTLDYLETALFDAWQNAKMLRNPRRGAILHFPPRHDRTRPDSRFSGDADVWSVGVELASEMSVRRFYVITQLEFAEYGREQRGQGEIFMTETGTGRVEIFIRLTDPEPEVLQAIERWRLAIAGAASAEPNPAGDAVDLQLPWANEDWYLGLVIEDRLRYDALRPYKDAWEANGVSEATLARQIGKTPDTTRRWRRDLRKKGALDMEWEKRGVQR